MLIEIVIKSRIEANQIESYRITSSSTKKQQEQSETEQLRIDQKGPKERRSALNLSFAHHLIYCVRQIGWISFSKNTNYEQLCKHALYDTLSYI